MQINTLILIDQMMISTKMAYYCKNGSNKGISSIDYNGKFLQIKLKYGIFK